MYYANSNYKKAGVTILISDKTDFKTQNVTLKKGGTFYNYKQINLSERHTNYQHVCT